MGKELFWTLVGGTAELAALKGWWQAVRKIRPVRVLQLEISNKKDLASLEPYLEDASCVVVAGHYRRSPRNMVPGLFLRDRNMRQVPIGWVPVRLGRMRTFFRTQIMLLRRGFSPELTPGPHLLLGQWEERSLRMANRTYRAISEGESGISVYNWMSNRLGREELVDGLTCGAGSAFYFGHARPKGWSGYHGIRLRHLHSAPNHPVGAILSLTCDLANRHHVGESFAEGLVTRGICGASVAAICATRNIDNLEWATGLSKTLANTPIRHLSQWLTQTEVSHSGIYSPYRLIGDPMVSICGAPCSVEACATIEAPDPDSFLDEESELS